MFTNNETRLLFTSGSSSIFIELITMRDSNRLILTKKYMYMIFDNVNRCLCHLSSCITNHESAEANYIKKNIGVAFVRIRETRYILSCQNIEHFPKCELFHCGALTNNMLLLFRMKVSHELYSHYIRQLNNIGNIIRFVIANF